MSLQKIKRKILFLFLAGALLYGYFLISLGMLWGYFLAKFLAGKRTGEPPRIFRSLIIKIKDYQLHLHHWLYSLFILILGAIFQISLILNQFVLGLLLGVIFQGIADYQDWKKIVIKK